MRAARIVASGTLSALGRGAAAVDPRGEGGIADDAELAACGLRKPRVARARLPGPTDTDPAAALLGFALDDLLLELDSELPDWRGRRVVLVVGTSSGGMWSQTRAIDAMQTGSHAQRALCARAPYWGPLAVLRKRLPSLPIVQVLAACASSAMAIGLGCRLLDADLAELVVVGGYDAVTPFVAAGFEALGATSSTRPRPFSLGRDGLVLGEGAALLALAHDTRPGRYVLGFGATSDAAHPTAPAANGAELARAARLALCDAGEPRGPMLLSAHGTATLSNDRAEASAIMQIARGDMLGVHAFKAQLGHSLGAGSALELLAALGCLEQAHIPPLPDAPHEELPVCAAQVDLSHANVVKLASAFGGSNVALVAGWLSAQAAGEQRTTKPQRSVRVSRIGEPCTAADLPRVASHTAVKRLHVLRLDALTALCATAALDVIDLAATEESARKPIAVVLGSVAATLEHNADYQLRLRTRGHSAADARRFPATSPNLAPGMLSILYGFTGPSLTVGAGASAPFEALLMGAQLVAGGDVDEALVIVGDCAGPAVSGVFEGAGLAPPAHGALALRLARADFATSAPDHGSIDHAKLAAILAQMALVGGGQLDEIGNVSEGRGAGDQRRASLATPPGWPALAEWLRTHVLR